ncbi:MAG: HupE/UreJ family protein [Burkholderiaceae bacterium]
MKNKSVFGMSLCFGALMSLLFSASAHAHHPLAGAPMETFSQGLLSGFGHPVLGFDHFFFAIALGVIAAFTAWRLAAPLFYLVAMVAGVIVCMNGWALPAVEAVIAVSVLVLGLVVLMGRSLSLSVAGTLFAGAGLFHGWAFGQSIAGTEAVSATVAGGYLLGLIVIQYVLAVAAGYFATYRWTGSSLDMRPRLTGAVVTGVGLVFVLEGLEAMLLPAMG